MKIAVIISSNNPETVWNAFRLANTSRSFDNEVSVFLLGQGVEAAQSSTLQFDVLEQTRMFHESGGEIICCGVCCESRKAEMPYLLNDLSCGMGTMRQLYGLIAEADKVLTF
jgi:uncharacterized protein involved in oxidation of intracellular sulfur